MCMYARLYVYVCMHACMFECKHVFVRLLVYVFVWLVVWLVVWLCASLLVCIWPCVCVYVCVDLCVYIYIQFIYLQPASPHYYRSLLNDQVIQVRVETPSKIRACWFWVFEVTVVRFGHMLSIRKKDRLG